MNGAGEYSPQPCFNLKHEEGIGGRRKHMGATGMERVRERKEGKRCCGIILLYPVKMCRSHC